MLGLAAAGRLITPRAVADELGPVVAAQDAYVASTAATTTYDTAELRARNVPAQRLQSYLKFDLTAPGNVEAREAQLRRRHELLGRHRRRRSRSLPQPAAHLGQATEAEVDLQVGDRIDDA
jgi:hypothetical protein